MKFQCERCKTRYSIADDRVKGKILKIRCKNCSAVITVKDEGGTVADPGAAAAAAAASAQPVVPRPAAAGAAAAARAAAAQPAAATSALAGAFAKAIKQPAAASEAVAAPASFEAEWYVSVDGEQHGPYSLAKAQEWVAERPTSDELHCWSEGFDDWLPVEKVSHFRGRRAATGSPVARAPSVAPRPASHGGVEGEMTMVEAPPGKAAARAAAGPPTEETPPPLFAKALARVTAEAPTQTDEEPPDILKKPAAAARPGTPAAAGTPPFDLKLPTPRAAAPAIPSAARPSLGAAAAKPTASAPVATRAPQPALPDAALPDDDVVDSGPPEGDGDFEIGEVSRVVNLAMLSPRIGGATGSFPRLPTSAVGLATAAKGPSGTEQVLRTGAFPQLAASPAVTGAQPAVGGEAARVEAPVAKSRQYRLFIAFGVAGAILVGAIVVVLIATIGGESGDGDIVRGRGAGDEIAYQFQQEARKQEAAAAAGRGAEAARRTATTKRPRAVGEAPAVAAGGPAALVGGDETAIGGVPPGARPLDGDDLMKVQQQNQLGLQMCFNRELKRDPFLKVPKAYVALKVGLSGQVQSVSIPALAGTSLGTCLESFIRKWRFPPTTEVFSGQFPVVFSSR